MKKRDEQTVGDVVREYLKAQGLERQMAEAEVLNAFQDLIGKEMARYCGEVHFRNGTLCIEVRSAVLKNEMMMNREKMRNDMNRKAGMEVVERIFLV
ncbi:MAG: DUF721 domain-containing protein [Paludibacteraceae bacterium]|jgi:hypothetical protein|nr:DUF721 domain-containing protein [Paludibacteraceae bacterium]MCR5299026.1 DUF721 domain-containing protein [Paludibacteraceae bacterium]